MHKQYKLNFSLNHKNIKNNKELLKNKLKTLSDLRMRPAISGRKSQGYLVAYENGFKFVTKSNKQFILMLSDIKQAIFQPCDENMIIIIHFYLKNKVAVKDKLTEHV